MSAARRVTLGALSAALLPMALLCACKEKSACTTEGLQADVSGNHGHTVELTAEDVERGAGKRFAIAGGTHKHAVALTTADLDALKARRSVETRASSANAHTHEITIRCGK